MTKNSSIFDRWRTEDILRVMFYFILMFIFGFLLAAFGWWVICYLIGFEFSWNWAMAFYVCTVFFGNSSGLKLTFSE